MGTVQNIKKPKNIAIDISPLQDSNSKRGVGFYTRLLIDSLHTEIKLNPDFSRFKISLVTNNIFPAKTSLIHYPFFNPFQKTLPAKTYCPTIVTIHDLIPRQLKKYYPVGLKGEINWLFQKHRLKNIDYIITDSHTSKYEIHRHTGYPLDRMYVIYLAAADYIKPVKNTAILKKIQKKYHLPDKFVLYVGDINYNKNIPLLVNTCLDLKYPLVIIGDSAKSQDVPTHPWTKDLLWLQSKAKTTPASQLILTGFVPDSEISAIYSLATIYCQPSFAEGFGLPLVEAMQAGCPTVYSSESCLEEISQNSGISFSPYSAQELSLALKQIWTSPLIANKLIKLGLKRAKYFSWSFTAKQTLSVYQLALL